MSAAPRGKARPGRAEVTKLRPHGFLSRRRDDRFSACCSPHRGQYASSQPLSSSPPGARPGAPAALPQAVATALSDGAARYSATYVLENREPPDEQGQSSHERHRTDAPASSSPNVATRPSPSPAASSRR